jgi:hypothetical protein
LGTAEADEMEGRIYGIGNQSCGTWTEAGDLDQAKQWSDKAFQAMWVEGYVTAMSTISVWVVGDAKEHPGHSDSAVIKILREPMHVTDYHGMEKFIDQDCAANPLKTISEAAFDLTLHMRD